jgi:branched-chain amino acid transport system permease protein
MSMLPQTRIGQAALLAGFLALALLPLVLPPFYLMLGSTAFVAATFALSLQLLVGGAGLVSLGHAAFFGIAAYSVYLISPADTPLSVVVTLPVAMGAAGLAALVIGAFALRTRTFFFLMVTLAFGQMVYFVFHDTGLGGGADGVFAPRPILGVEGFELPMGRRERGLTLYYVNLAVMGATFLVLAGVLASLFGRVLVGIRVNEHRMRMLGYDVYAYKLAAFTLAGTLAGLAGHMFVVQEGFVNPELVGWHSSAEVLLMIILGGLGALVGPVLGAIALTALGEASQMLTERQLLVEGLVILAVVLVLPRGLAGLFNRRARTPEASDAAATADEAVPSQPPTRVHAGPRARTEAAP